MEYVTVIIAVDVPVEALILTEKEEAEWEYNPVDPRDKRLMEAIEAQFRDRCGFKVLHESMPFKVD